VYAELKGFNTWKCLKVAARSACKILLFDSTQSRGKRSEGIRPSSNRQEKHRELVPWSV
jgi:hypothetical protein